MSPSPRAGGSLRAEDLAGLGRAIARGDAVRSPAAAGLRSEVQASPTATAQTGPGERQRAAARRRRWRAQVRRRRLLAGSLLTLGAVAVLLVAFGGDGAAPGARSSRTVSIPSPVLTSLVGHQLVVPGAAPALGWPAKGEVAVAVQGVGLVGQSPSERSVPIASLTKLMTAYLVLQAHPLLPGEQGPSLRMTAADVAAWERASESDDSNAPVRAGEVLTEYQLLEALLIPSADNIADRLGQWVAGSDAAFVARMNATASELGLSYTHYADASGVDPGSRSTAADQAKLASLLMEQPVVRQIVAHPSVPFPVAGTLWNYNPALGVDGIVGIKSGFTSEAQGCLATAAWRVVGGRRVLLVTVSLGQPDGLYGAARTDEHLLTQAATVLEPVSVLRPGESVASIRVPWSTARLTAVAPAATGLTVVGWPHLVLHESLVAVPGAELAAAAEGSAAGAGGTGTSQPSGGTGVPGSSVPVAAGQARRAASTAAGPAVVGHLVVRAPAGTVASVPLAASGPIPAVPPGWAPTSG